VTVLGNQFGNGGTRPAVVLGLALATAESFLFAVLPRLHRLTVDVLQTQGLPRALSIGLVGQVGQESLFDAPHDLRDRRLAE
jgi:hypothetical protein